MAKNDEKAAEEEQQGGGWNFGHGFGHDMHQTMRAQFGQRGWLRPSVLKLLDEKPMNGMEIINRFYEASHGWWKPSPGSIYPLLETLETDGLIKKRGDGRYAVANGASGEGKHTSQVDEMITNMEGTISYLEELKKSNKPGFSAYEKRIEKVASRLSKL